MTSWKTTNFIPCSNPGGDHFVTLYLMVGYYLSVAVSHDGSMEHCFSRSIGCHPGLHCPTPMINKWGILRETWISSLVKFILVVENLPLGNATEHTDLPLLCTLSNEGSTDRTCTKETIGEPNYQTNGCDQSNYP